MQLPNRRERRLSKLKRKKNNPQSYQDFLNEITDNVIVGKEIHNSHVENNEILAKRKMIKLQEKDYKNLMSIYKDEVIVNKMLKEKYTNNHAN